MPPTEVSIVKSGKSPAVAADNSKEKDAEKKAEEEAAKEETEKATEAQLLKPTLCSPHRQTVPFLLPPPTATFGHRP